MKEIILTHIDPPVNIFSERARRVDMNNRKSYGLALCISGQITYTYEGRQYVSVPDTALLLPKGGTYTLYGNKEGIFPLLNFQCFTPPWEGMQLIPLSDGADCLRRFRELSEIYAHSGSGPEFYSAVYGLLHAVFKSEHSLPDIPNAACRLIDQRLGDPALCNGVLARELGISEVWLRKLFTAHLGVSPRRYILNARILKACRLLQEGGLSVTEIAAVCGFSSPYHFSRSFKEHTALSPTEYAKTHRHRSI